MINPTIPLSLALLFFSYTVFASPHKLDIKSQAALIYDTQNKRILYDKNADKVMPIASITKLMAAMVSLDARLPLNDRITITAADVDKLRHSSSRLPVGSNYARHELLRLSLMSSENRATAALARTYPGGTQAFVRAMNQKAQKIGMTNSRFADATGLNQGNVSTARDLAKLVITSNHYAVIRDFSTTVQHRVARNNNRGQIQFVNSNSLVRNQDWQIDVSKTGYISAAGRCLVMKADISGDSMVIVLLNSWGKNTRIGDANRMKKWIETNYSTRSKGHRVKHQPATGQFASL
ncbi:murein-DD-endopeptidase. Serine peptidase. MEROPS family S11 [Nitrosomonas sp. PY1]|uniref:D-alanyl-D-alanine endopeptidase n=1 Tax=Nitrosomonas sp. PY1 TaxID=1803906 RepID=UPI001FC8E418|nr:D-alanyl-D-alanine endopeptidase [Nitrosomonas sp. PY1]GKS69165.1 murein-DD-endopeptidase. Serine peptidase. MEROPS family S11 [Nitrosomonas sp. PY1]